MPEPASETSIDELVTQHYRMLYRYAFRLSGTASDAEDLTQQTYLHAQAHLNQLRDPERARAWLCAILRNCFRKQLRQRRSVSLDCLESFPIEAAASADGYQGDIDEEELQHALAELPEEFRAPVILYYFGDFSYRQIAEQMLIPIGTVMSRLARAKAQLRARLLERAGGQKLSAESS